MNKYVLVDGKPYLFADGRAYAVRRNKEGFTVGKAVELPEIPTRTYSELSINAKYPDGFDSIGEEEVITPDEPEAEVFTAVSDEAINGRIGAVDADADDIVIVRDGKDLVIPNEAHEFVPDGMTVAELRAYAKEHGYDLGSARTKDAIIEAITKARTNDETA